MKRLGLLGPAVLLLTGVWLLSRRDSGGHAPAEAQSGPPLSLESDMAIDFGALRMGQDAHALALLSNRSTTPVHLRRVRSTCGCTVVKPSTEVIDPQASLELEIRPNTWTVGHQVADVFVQVDEWPDDIMAAQLRFSVVEELSVWPSAPRIEVGANSDPQQTVLVVTASEGELAPCLQFAFDRPGIEVRADIAPTRAIVRLLPNPDSLARGMYYATLAIRSGPTGTLIKECPVLISHDVENVYFEPALLHAEATELDDPVRVFGRLRWNGAHVVPTQATSLDPKAIVRACERHETDAFVLTVDLTAETEASARFDVLYATWRGNVIGGVVVGARFDPARVTQEFQHVRVR